MPLRNVLIVEDDDNSSELLATVVESEGYAPSVARTLAEARQLLVVHRPALVILDLGLPDGSGMELFEDEALRGDTEVILITGNASVETSIQALRLGAADYLVKPISLKMLRSAIARLDRRHLLGATAPPPDAADKAAEQSEPSREGKAPARRRQGADDGDGDGDEAQRFGKMWGRSEIMRSVFAQISRVARTSISVFIVGESGTGKELVAESIHMRSHRRRGPFEAVNCGAISAQLIESELFGHEKGSFTGAIKQHRGFFERASGGTLFLDEVTEMPLELQVKLLRVLETGTFSRVGSDRLLHSDVRVVAATNRQPLEAVREGKLREDLYYRLNVFQIALPALRERPEDLPLIARQFLASFAEAESRRLAFGDAALAALQQWSWPGNVRELRNYVQRIAVMADAEVIEPDMLLPFDANSQVVIASAAGSPAAGSPADPGADPLPSAGSGAASMVGAVPPAQTAAAAAPVAVAPGEPAAAASPAATGPAAEDTMPRIDVQVGMTIADAERALILGTLDYCAGAKERTADMLGISLKTLYNRLRAYSED